MKHLPEMLQVALIDKTPTADTAYEFPVKLGDKEIGIALAFAGTFYSGAAVQEALMLHCVKRQPAVSPLPNEYGNMLYTVGVDYRLLSAVGAARREMNFNFNLPYPMPFARAPWVWADFTAGANRFIIMMYYTKLKATDEEIARLLVKQ